jgi:predicted phage tail component-like protein
MLSFSFNNIRKSYVYMLEGRMKAPFAPIHRTIVKFPGGHRLKKSERGLLDIHQPIGFVAIDNITALNIKDDLASWLVTENPVPLQFDDEPGRTYMAVVQNTLEDFDKFVRLRKGTIQFVSLESLGQTHNLNIHTEFETFTILGQDKTPWTSKTTFAGSANQYILENNQGGKIILNYNFIAGDVLEIDYKKRKVTLNGNLLQTAISIYSHWFDLKPGQMQIKASHPTTLTYTERYY